jgi:cytochrome P450
MHDDRSVRFPLGDQVRLEALSRDPYPVLKALQEGEPVSWVGELQAWFVTRRADCLAILLDSTTYSVASTASLLEDTLGQTMLSTDGARQRQLRQPFNGPFSPKAVQARMAAPIAAYVHDLIDAFAAVLRFVSVFQLAGASRRPYSTLEEIFCERLRLVSTLIIKSDQHAGLDHLSRLHSAKPHELEDMPSLALW